MQTCRHLQLVKKFDIKCRHFVRQKHLKLAPEGCFPDAFLQFLPIEYVVPALYFNEFIRKPSV